METHELVTKRSEPQISDQKFSCGLELNCDPMGPTTDQGPRSVRRGR